MPIEFGDQAEADRACPAAPLVMTWEEIEQVEPMQLKLPGLGFSLVPTVAERVFLTLAREWQTEGDQRRNPCRIGWAFARSRLLLAVEWGPQSSNPVLDDGAWPPAW